ncbi:unnamed protein product [Dovyalis caffra]|uniref:Brf1 TBP-binding domain-containing protein n=1 Tax=Dovyalis caffra TaxID=77055 RepID=A0AAV1RGJ3_9ROSI|nr:unnamed protein product [Dovyalis caffra]
MMRACPDFTVNPYACGSHLRFPSEQFRWNMRGDNLLVSSEIGMEKGVKSYSKPGLNAIKGGASASRKSKSIEKFKRTKVASGCHQNMEKATNWLVGRQSRSTAVAHDSEDLSDIDDAEISGYLLHNEKEMEFKRTLWEMINKKYLEGKQLKGARKVKKSTPAKKAIKISGQTENKTRLSSKINYDVLKKILGDEPEEVPGKAEDGEHSNAYPTDVQQVDENSIPEEHSSGAGEENEEYEHDYGEFDAEVPTKKIKKVEELKPQTGG